MTSTRKAILSDVLPYFEVASEPGEIDLRSLLPGLRTVVDFGAGMGTHAIELAESGVGVLAVDVHLPGICAIALHAHENSLTNVRVHLGDGVDLLHLRMATQCVDELHVLFPDPWPKTRHHKRRLINEPFLALAHRVLAPGGRLVVVTDDAGYTAHIGQTVRATALFTQDATPFDYHPTGYHERALQHGNTIAMFSLTAV